MIADFVSSCSDFSASDRVLIGVSGGVDSMVLLDLLCRCRQELSIDKIAIAHCNFSLRGAQSDSETELVIARAKELGVECFVEKFDTNAYADAQGLNTQLAARELRYDFFERLCTTYDFNKIAIAHHASDSIETFFINLTRGTGLRGLTGIPRTRGKIVRPLLGFSREWIERHAVDHDVEYLNDASNATLDYLRNRMRHDIIPRIDSSVPSFAHTMGRNMEHLTAAQRFIDEQVAAVSDRVFVDGTLDLVALRAEQSFNFLLFELLRPYGFSPSVIADIASADHSGREFFAARYTALYDRGRLLITPRSRREFVERTIERDDTCIEWLTVDELPSLATASNVALLSADALQFPLRLRKWQHGDWFIPLGLKGQKKVSDLLIDQKVPLTEKESQGVLLSGRDTIIWVVGRRIDDRFRVEERSRAVVRITL